MILFIWFLPIGTVVGLIGLSPLGLILIGVFAVLALVSLMLWGDITSLLTSRTFATLDSDEPQKNSPISNTSGHTPAQLSYWRSRCHYFHWGIASKIC